MKKRPPRRVERFRIKKGLHRSDKSFGNNGAFLIPGPNADVLKIIISDGLGWEHVSVSCERRSPTWREMCFIKDLFFEAEEVVIQYHPPRSIYKNHCEYCLHMWRPIGNEIPMPPLDLV